MNEEMKDLLQKALLKALEIAEKTGEFVVEQSPIILQEFYSWHFAKAGFLAILAIIGAVITYKLGIKAKNTLKSKDYFKTPLPFMLHILTTAFIVLTFNNLYNMLFITVAPRIYLIEYFVKP